MSNNQVGDLNLNANQVLPPVTARDIQQLHSGGEARLQLLNFSGPVFSLKREFYQMT